ncbi:MAG: hypothetical protein KAX49_05245 [Halanaerobiales bacterium]|nr:hypothetical protein [Halanaerobiales bacterium]
MTLENLLEERIRQFYEKSKDDYIHMIAEWFSTIILTKEKYIVDHSYDPEWDCSGRLVSTGKKFDLDEYETFAEFIENEYTGNSSASYERGCGFFHDRYEYELEDITMNWLHELLFDAVSDLIKEQNPLLQEWLVTLDMEILYSIENADEITGVISDEDILADFIVFTFPSKVQQNVLNSHPKFLFKLGAEEARLKIEQEKKKKEERFKQIEEDRRKAEKLWERVIKIYQIRHGEKIASRIEKPLYNQKLKIVLEQLCDEGVEINEIQNIGELVNYNFSNSVKRAISIFRV